MNWLEYLGDVIPSNQNDFRELEIDLPLFTNDEIDSDLIEQNLLLDHWNRIHPEQKAHLKNKQPAGTKGSLRERMKNEAWLAFVRDLLSVENPAKKLEQLSQVLEEALENIFPVKPSKKHMNNRDTGKQEPSPSLKYRAQHAQEAMV